MEPREILDKTRTMIFEHSGNDPDKWFYANRFVFARLQLDERKTKTEIKKNLLESDQPCFYCKKIFEIKTGLHLHRMDGNKGYSKENCVLMHADCHIKYHSENPNQKGSGRPRNENDEADPALLEKISKRYDSSFLYWWDISPSFETKMDQYDAIEFIKKDTLERCHVPIPAIRGYLTEQRQTTRGKGNWGIKILAKRENELAFEPGKNSDNWLFLPVVWLTESEG